MSLAAQQLGGLGQIFGFGAAQQSQAQAELQDDIIRFAEEHSLTDPEDLAIIMGLLGINFSTSSSGAETTPRGPGFTALTAGAGAAIAG